MSEELYQGDSQKINALSAAVGGRMNKHDAIDQGIERVNGMLDRLQDLIEEIAGNDRPADPQVPSNTMRSKPLLEVLNEAPERLQKISIRLDDQILHLKDMLF